MDYQFGDRIRVGNVTYRYLYYVDNYLVLDGEYGSFLYESSLRDSSSHREKSLPRYEDLDIEM